MLLRRVSFAVISASMAATLRSITNSGEGGLGCSGSAGGSDDDGEIDINDLIKRSDDCEDPVAAEKRRKTGLFLRAVATPKATRSATESDGSDNEMACDMIAAAVKRKTLRSHHIDWLVARIAKAPTSDAPAAIDRLEAILKVAVEEGCNREVEAAEEMVVSSHHFSKLLYLILSRAGAINATGAEVETASSSTHVATPNQRECTRLDDAAAAALARRVWGLAAFMQLHGLEIVLPSVVEAMGNLIIADNTSRTNLGDVRANRIQFLNDASKAIQSSAVKGQLISTTRRAPAAAVATAPQAPRQT